MKQMFQSVPSGSSNTGNNITENQMNMERRITVLVMLALITLPSIMITGWVAAAPLTIQTDKTYYLPGEEVIINGTVESKVNVTIIINSTRETILNITIEAYENGTYTYLFQLPQETIPGRYNVYAIVSGEAAETNFTVVFTELKDLAQNLISMAQSSRIHVEEAFDELEERNITIPTDAMQSYNLGVEYLEDAQRLFSEGQYRAAMNLAFGALQRFMVALQKAHRIAPPPPPYEGFEELERAQGLRVAIERANATLNRINSTLTSLSTHLNDIISTFNSMISDAEEHLINAAVQLEAGNVTGAAQELATARGIIGRLTGLLNSAAARLKAMKALRFMERMEEQVKNLEEKVLRFRLRLTEREMGACMEALRNVESKLARIRERLAQGDVEGASDELEEASELVERGIRNLERRELNLFLGEMNRLEARIRSLRNTADALKNKGLNTSRAEEKLDEAEELLKSAMSSMESGGDAGESLKNAEKLIEEAEELLQGLTRPKGLGVKGGWPPQKGKGKGR